MGSALYRRYRPESFAELIGQTQVTDPLRQALVADRTHHAYLFSGPRGCGKTTSARILARCLNCAEGPTDTPCGSCPSCVELARDGGGSLDVVEIDAASHNGVEDARELRERAVFAPSRDRYKIFILDEAHMVTQQGFNALLKIVEEPPEHIKFIFATTEPDKVLTTIRSRTHHYPFRLVAPAELISYLQSVIDTEGLGVEDGVLALVVRAGGGSVRDSLSLLDQLMAGTTGDTLTLHDARTLLGYTSAQVLDDATVAIAEMAPRELFTLIDGVIHSGGDPRRFVEDFLSHIRDLIVAQATGGGDQSLFPGVPAHDVARLHEHASLFSGAQLTKMADISSQTLGQMAGVTSPKLQLEVMMAKILALSDTPALPQTVTTAANSDPASPGSQQQTPRAATPTGPVSPPPSGSPPHVEAEDTAVEPMSLWDLAAAVAVWPGIIDSLAETKRSLWAALSGTRPIAVEEDVLTIGFVRRSDAEILRKPQGPGSPLPNADLLREAIYSHTGHRPRFTVGELPPHPTTPAVEAESGSWPVVSPLGSTTPEETTPPDSGAPSAGHNDPPEVASPVEAVAEEADTALQVTPQKPSTAQNTESGEAVDPSDLSDDEPVVAPAEASTLGQRGEPAIRTLLGGELIAEEQLEPPALEEKNV